MAKDIFHTAVKEALEKEGWRITHDPMYLQVGGVPMYIDLAADSLVAAKKGEEYIAVEIKSFVGLSAIYDFHLALGQYRNYQLALLKTDPDRMLYLAVPEEISEQFFSLPFVQDSLVYNEINYLVYDSEQEVILQWTKN